MKRYIGIDAHKESCTVAVMGPSGRHLRQEVVETNGQALKKLIRSMPGDKHLCLEEGEYSEWLFELCQPLAAEVVVEQPPGIKGPKSDSRDAWARADDLRRGMLHRRVFKAPGVYGSLREAVRAHLAMQQDLVRAKNRLKGVFRSRGFMHTGQDLYHPARRSDWMAKLPRVSRKRALVWANEVDRISEAADEVEAWLLQEAKRTPAVKLLTTAPGIGWIRASQIVAIVISPGRFPTSRHFWSYCGLGVVTSVSAEWVRDSRKGWIRAQIPMPRGLNRNRNPFLKAVFKAAALTVIRGNPDHPLKRGYEKSLERTKPHLARLTLARRIAATVLAMWKNEEVYDPAKQDRAKTR